MTKRINSQSLSQFQRPNVHARVTLFETFADRMKNDLASGIYGYLTAVYLGFIDRDFDRGYQKIVKLINSDHHLLRALGLRALGLVSGYPGDKWQQVIECLIASSKDSDTRIASNAAFSICRLATVNAELVPEVVRLSESVIPEIKYEVASSLRFKDAAFNSSDDGFEDDAKIYPPRRD